MNTKKIIGVATFGLVLAFAPVVMAQNINDEGAYVPEEEQYMVPVPAANPLGVTNLDENGLTMPMEGQDYYLPSTSFPTDEEMEPGTPVETYQFKAPAPSQIPEQQWEQGEDIEG